MSPCPSTPHWDLSHVIAGAGAGSPVKSRDRAAKSWGRSDRGGRGGVCVFETPPPLRVFSSGLRSEACLFRSFLMVPLQTEPPPPFPPRARSGSIRDFFPGSLGRMTCPAPREGPALPPNSKPRALLPSFSSGSLTPGRPADRRPPVRRPDDRERATLRVSVGAAGQGAFFLIWAKRLGAPQIAQTPAWLLGCAPVTWPEPSCTGF
jgi:hypothetical protein